MDCEIVGIDKKNNKILPFQRLMNRGRKNIELSKIEIQVCLFAFDLLYLNGKSLLRETLSERRKALLNAFQEIPGEFQFAQHADITEQEKVEEFLASSIEQGCEGLMVKALEVNASYEPSKRSMNWLKLKKDYIKGLGDSFDLVPIGGYYGTGKRTGVYGGFLLACYDSSTEQFQSICKIGTGFSEQDLKDLAKSLNQHKIPAPKPYYSFATGLKPDVWFNASQVWEILAADLTLSPQHTAAIGTVDESKGISIRFPRFIRVREDKTPEQATDASQVAEMFLNQAQQK